MRSPNRPRSTRRGSALFLVMVMVGAMGALALSAIILTGNATLVGASYDKEADLRYAAETGLAIGKARLNFDPTALPDTGYVTLLNAYKIKAVDNQPVNGVTVSVYLGPTGSTSGQFGRFASIVAEARDARGTGFVRRLELTQESFAKFAYWSQSESNTGGTIYFAGNDNLWGPVFSDDKISIASGGPGPYFHDEVSTAQTIVGASYATFSKGYKQNSPNVTLPSNTTLSKLSGYATSGGFNFAPTTSGDISGARMRIEFVALDMNGDNDSTDVDEGFFKVYEAASGQSQWLRGDWPTGTSGSYGTHSGDWDESDVTTCGDFHAMGATGKLMFFPVSVHNNVWFKNLMKKTTATGGAGMTTTNAGNEQTASVGTIMGHPGSRCYLGGDPHLAAVERVAANYPDTLTRYIGGQDTTFTHTGTKGVWRQFSATPNATLLLKRPNDAKDLFPLYRGINANTKGVIYASGTVGVSGVVRGKITLYATGSVGVLDDIRYASDPGLGTCSDILGIISGHDVTVADNALNTPQFTDGSGGQMRMLDDTKDLYIHSIFMALNTSFGVEDYTTGPKDFSDCLGSNVGRGCLYLTGGVIQVSRGAVGLTDGHGYTKQYSYDRCAVVSPPPYFPTTGRFQDSRYFEIDPVGFNVKNLFLAITPDK